MCDHLVTIGFDYDGGFADYMLIPYIAIVNGCVNKLPDSISYEEATLAEPLACCINAQELARIGFGQTVVVLGAGPLGCMHAMLAKCRGAAKTILVDVLPERIERAQVTDADLYVNAAKEDLVPYIRAITGKRGADTVIIACESEKAEKDALAMVAKHGTISLFSRRSDTEKGLGFDINAVHFKEVFIVGSHGSSPRQNTIAIEMISAKRIAIINLITHRMEIDRIWDGLTLCDRKACLRVVITKYDNDALSTCLDI
jgi:L-iditol 2-dehydrogenase